MDDFDRASELETRERAAAVEAARARAAAEARTTPAGSCANCGELLEGDKRFCDQDCRDQYERRARARARNGRYTPGEDL